MKLRRGFKTEAEQYASEFRAELRLATDGPLCPFQLAAWLEIPVVPLSKLDGFDAANPNYHPGETQFHAATLARGTHKTIFHNDSKHPNRQRSNVMHEIAHILLGHPAHPPLMEDGCRNFDSLLEHEAKELSFALRVSKPAARKIIATHMTLSQASVIYGTSTELIEYRIRITDARGWFVNRAKYN